MNESHEYQNVQNNPPATGNQPARHEAPSTADMAATAGRERTDKADMPRPAGPTSGEAPSHPERRDAGAEHAQALLPQGEAQPFRDRWSDVQAAFVDNPRDAVKQADTLVAEVMQRLAKVFADERSKLEGQWSRGENVSTEELRVALQRYRTFFDRLLSV